MVSRCEAMRGTALTISISLRKRSEDTPGRCTQTGSGPPHAFIGDVHAAARNAMVEFNGVFLAGPRLLRLATTTGGLQSRCREILQ